MCQKSLQIIQKYFVSRYKKSKLQDIYGAANFNCRCLMAIGHEVSLIHFEMRKERRKSLTYTAQTFTQVGKNIVKKL